VLPGFLLSSHSSKTRFDLPQTLGPPTVVLLTKPPEALADYRDREAQVNQLEIPDFPKAESDGWMHPVLAYDLVYKTVNGAIDLAVALAPIATRFAELLTTA
jgi:hypothetical protein